jgi:hypothetical protein
VDKVAGCLRAHQFPLPILIPPTAPHSSFVTRGWCNRPKSGRRTKWTQSYPTPRITFKLSLVCNICNMLNVCRCCRSWGSHSRGYKECHLLGYNAVWSVECQPTFRRKV